MHISDVEKYRKEKEHEMRYGHLSHADRQKLDMRHNFPDTGDKHYHSPENEGVDYNSHGVELQ